MNKIENMLLKEYNHRKNKLILEIEALQSKKDDITGKTTKAYKKLQKEIAKSGEMILEYQSQNMLGEVKHYFSRLDALVKLLKQYEKDVENKMTQLQVTKYQYDREAKSLLEDISTDKELISKVKSLPEYEKYLLGKNREKILIEGGSITRVGG